MNVDVAKADNPLAFTDPGAQCRVKLVELQNRFADRDEFAFDGGPKATVGQIVFVFAVGGEADEKPGRNEYSRSIPSPSHSVPVARRLSGVWQQRSPCSRRPLPARRR